jgi:cytochrome c-type biogenesis protein CcmH
VILFWLICAAMLAVAILFVLPPALRSEAGKAKHEDARREANIAVYRDQLAELEADLRNGIVSEEQYAQDRDDIERRLLEDTATNTAKKKPAKIDATARKHAYMVAIGLALVAVIFYLRVGSPDGVTNAAVNNATGLAPSAAPATAPGERTQAQIEANVAALAKKLQSDPSDAQGWTMLARSYSSLEKYSEAVGAYAKATELTPNDANLWADYAFASAMANGRSLAGQPLEFVNRALKLDPDNGKALGLAANAAFEAKDYQKAIDYWQRLAKQVPPNSEIAKTIMERINEASHKKAQEAQGTQEKRTATP